MKIVVLGADGQLGQEFRYLNNQFPMYQIDYLGKSDLDISKPSELSNILGRLQPDVLINCAAYTAVDRAEDQKEKAYLINQQSVQNLAKCAKDLNLLLIHFSTDYVYDSHAELELTELSPCSPKGVYARSKLAGEREIIAEDINYIIIRVSWLYSSFRNNFVKTMLRIGKVRDEVSVVLDQIGSPTYARDLAFDTLNILGQLNLKNSNIQRVYNYSNEGITSWNKFAEVIFHLSNIECAVKSISTEDFGAKAPRPKWSVMSKNKIKTDFNLKLKDWKESLKECLEELDAIA